MADQGRAGFLRTWLRVIVACGVLILVVLGGIWLTNRTPGWVQLVVLGLVLSAAIAWALIEDGEVTRADWP